MPTLAPEREADPCGWPGCKDDGLYRAPVSRENLNTYHWFCMIHVREYNKTWNYYAGMSEQEVEDDVRKDTVWQRPSWQWGSAPNPNGVDPSKLRKGLDGLDGLGDLGGLGGPGGPGGSNDGPTEKNGHLWHSHSPEGEALVILDLRPPVTTATVKTRYKELVKKHHPDANGGTKESEEKFKLIGHAYQILLESLAS